MLSSALLLTKSGMLFGLGPLVFSILKWACKFELGFQMFLIHVCQMAVHSARFLRPAGTPYCKEAQPPHPQAGRGQGRPAHRADAARRQAPVPHRRPGCLTHEVAVGLCTGHSFFCFLLSWRGMILCERHVLVWGTGPGAWGRLGLSGPNSNKCVLDCCPQALP